MMMGDEIPLRLTLQKQHPQTHASASVSTTPSAKLRLSGARRSCSLQVRDHLQASWISRAGAAAARFPAGGPPRLYQERQVRRRGSRQSPELGGLGLPKVFAPDRTITAPNTPLGSLVAWLAASILAQHVTAIPNPKSEIRIRNPKSKIRNPNPKSEIQNPKSECS